MDRYLFRGKRVDNGEWVQGYFMMSEPTKFTKMTHPTIVDEKTGMAEFVMPATIGQCIGLRDENGTLIFEGDGVLLGVGSPCYGAKAVIKWDKLVCGYFAHTEYDDWYTLEETGSFLKIIGNIHDDLELVEAQDEAQ